jgi:hypothetical protein
MAILVEPAREFDKPAALAHGERNCKTHDAKAAPVQAAMGLHLSALGKGDDKVP